jgi:nucleotide-binding universal stress UspA family protein
VTAPYAHVVVGSDGSDTAEHAVDSAAHLAAALGLPITIATAWYRDMPDEPVPSETSEFPTGDAGAMEATWADMTVSDGAAIARKRDVVEVNTATPQGHAADSLLDEASRHDRTLLVVGTAGLGSRTERMLGNVPHQITHHAASDVLLVRSDTKLRAPYRRIALATDGSRTARIATERGLALTRAIGAEAILVTVARTEGRGEDVLARVRSEVDAEDLEGRVIVGKDIARELGDVAADADLLVLGNKGMSGPSRLLGSVANEVTHAVPTDLLLVNTVGRRSR